MLAGSACCIPTILKAFDLDGPVVAVEMFLDAIPRRRGGAAIMRAAYAPPPLQAVTRDFAFLVPAELPAERAAPRGEGRRQGSIVDARLFDVFTGAGVPEGQKIAGDRSHAPAGREELHRRGAQGDRRQDRRRGGEARRGAARLIKALLAILIVVIP